MRGRRFVLKKQIIVIRNTPAYAGKTDNVDHSLNLAEKHPRVCGEDFRSSILSRGTWETPPRMRGRLRYKQLTGILDRNTPAYAGKTPAFVLPTVIVVKHPRVCGEDLPTEDGSNKKAETPPRMRGRRYYANKIGRPFGNTPAYAGKTSTARLSGSCARKHPRVCGEDSTESSGKAGFRETPPRMRGRQYHTVSSGRKSGNTPAYAGKTQTPECRRPAIWKHPRVCGEDFPTS